MITADEGVARFSADADTGVDATGSGSEVRVNRGGRGGDIDTGWCTIS
jgi:hypothetical protein